MPITSYLNKLFGTVGITSRTTPSIRFASSNPPSGISRDDTFYDWCPCGVGLTSVLFWPDDNYDSRVSVPMNSSIWVQFDAHVRKISWSCNQDAKHASSTDIFLKAGEYISLLVQQGTKRFQSIFLCKQSTGRLRWNTWTQTSYISSVPFTTGTEGYACFKIPALLSTSSGLLLAFAEARKPDCSDFALTELVMKRSTDRGRTWSDLQVVVEVSEEEQEKTGLCGHKLVIGNAAPVQLRQDSKRHPGRILLPYTRNNFKAWLIYSDDDGITWTGDRELAGMTLTETQPDCQRGMDYFGFDLDKPSISSLDDLAVWLEHLCKKGNPFDDPTMLAKLTGPWQFFGTGPPGSLQLTSGRVLVPAYHSYVRGLEGHGDLPISQLYNNLGRGHAMMSDDDGDTWQLGKQWPNKGQGGDEQQFVQLKNGSILSNLRSFSLGSPQFRLQARSDDGGESFTSTTLVNVMPQPFNGCQGSTFRFGDVIYVASPNPEASTSLLQDLVKNLRCDLNLTGRSQLTLWRSIDEGETYTEHMLLDQGLSAQTSLQAHSGKLVVLYEQADPEAPTFMGVAVHKLIQNMKVLIPSRFVYREIQ